MMNKKILAATVCALALLPGAHTRAQQTLTFCSPINLPYRYATLASSSDVAYREAADPTIVNFQGEYYLFASKCGVYYHSTDLVHWDSIHTDDLPIDGYAPTAIEMNGQLYFTHSVGTTRIWRTSDPKSGKWELVEGAGTSQNQNDPMLFADDDGRMFLFYGSSGNLEDGIMGVELNTKTLRPKSKATRLITGHPQTYGWEVPGDYNENTQSNPWVEGVWVNKVNGKYYLQYSVPGTETKSYCDAVYVSDSPLGPYTLQPHNPFCYRPEGFLAASGHGSTFQDNYGNWWHISTATISRRHMFERRLVLYPVAFDADGMMYSRTAFGDYPMEVPSRKVESIDALCPQWMLLSYGKPATASSAKTNHPASYAANEDVRTWWSATTGDAGEWLQLDLQAVCHIKAVQVNFADEGSSLSDDRTSAYQYKLETSSDGQTWTLAADKSLNNDCAPHDYFELADGGQEGRYVRITCVNCPSGQFSLSGLRVFGTATKAAPAAPRLLSVVRNADDPRQVSLTWSRSANATGYNIRYGIASDKRYLDHIIYGQSDTTLTIRSLNAELDYSFTVEAFGEGGITQAELMRADSTLVTLAADRDTYSLTPGGSSVLQIMATYQSGLTASVAFACDYVVADTTVAKVSGGRLQASTREGSTLVTATYTDALGQAQSVSFTVDVATFPLTKGGFNPSLVGTGTFTPTTGALRTAVSGMGGWDYAEGIDLSAFRYLVVNLRRAAACKPVLYVYDDADLSNPFTLDMGKQTALTVDLQQMEKADGTTAAPAHIYRIGFGTDGSSALYLKSVYVSDDGSTPSAILAVNGDAGNVQRTYYTIDGRRLSAPLPGLVIQRTRHADGHVSARKMLVR